VKQFKIISVLLLTLCLILDGCSFTMQDKQAKKDGHQVTDSQGYVLTLPLKPERIVSLSIATDEMLMELVPADRIAALTYLAEDSGISNIADEAKQVQTKIRANAEAVIALQPDLVLVPSWQPVELVEAMRDAGLPVYVFKSAQNIAEVRENIKDIANIVGEPEKGTDVVSRMDSALEKIAAKVKGILETDRQVAARFSNMGGSGGIGSTFDDICQHAGVKNAAAMAGLDRNGTLTKEQVVQVNPDFFLLPTWDYTGKKDLNQYKEEVQNDPALQNTKAVQNRRLMQVPDRYLFCTSQHIVKGVLSMAQTAYPKLFSNT
jgi:iron complex transport system substrate-binding protein